VLFLLLGFASNLHLYFVVDVLQTSKDELFGHVNFSQAFVAGITFRTRL
jgi:hypothetical protein